MSWCTNLVARQIELYLSCVSVMSRCTKTKVQLQSFSSNTLHCNGDWLTLMSFTSRCCLLKFTGCVELMRSLLALETLTNHQSSYCISILMWSVLTLETLANHQSSYCISILMRSVLTLETLANHQSSYCISILRFNHNLLELAGGLPRQVSTINCLHYTIPLYLLIFWLSSSNVLILISYLLIYNQHFYAQAS